MTARPQLERQLPGIFEELYLGSLPDYRDEVLAVAVRSRQRPRWTFAGRWLPMADISASRAFAPRVPWRLLALALLILALVAAGVFVAGSRQVALPAPFGVARDGLIAVTAGDDIRTIDPVTGQARAIVTGPEVDADAAFSPDGTRIAFHRRTDALAVDEDLVVVRPDGSDLAVITPQPVGGGFELFAWAPDSRFLLARHASGSDIWLYDTTRATPPRKIADDTAGVYLRPFRPPAGDAVLIARLDGVTSQIVVLDLATGRETIVAEDADESDLRSARWSPDGTRIVYNTSPADDPGTQRLFIVNADGTGRHQITDAPGDWYDADATWSPDGTRIAFTRWHEVSPGSWDVAPVGIYSLADGTVTSVGP